MKRIFILTNVLIVLNFTAATAQNIRRVIRTGALFQRIAPDARAGGMGDIGVATSPEAFSQYWNPAKYPFSHSYSATGISYTPYLSQITDDMFLFYNVFHTFLDEEERNALGASIYYFKRGKADLKEYIGNEIINIGTSNPNEFSIDMSYSLKLSDFFAMAVAIRYIRSDLFNNMANLDPKRFQGVKAANSFSVDVSGYYEREVKDYRSFDGRLRLGFNISNMGPKLTFSDTDNKKGLSLPTNLRIGAGYDFIFDETSQLGINLEVNKLLVSTPDKDGFIPDKNVIQGMLNSFVDAPGGLSEELQEINYSLGLEYILNQALKLRSGYFYEPLQKGGRQYATVGVGMNYNDFGFDASYLIPTGSMSRNNPLGNTLRFSLTWNFGGTTNRY